MALRSSVELNHTLMMSDGWITWWSYGLNGPTTPPRENTLPEADQLPPQKKPRCGGVYVTVPEVP